MILPLELYLINFGAVLSLMCAAWLISLRIKNVTIADTFWGLGFLLIAWITFSLSDGFLPRKIILVSLVTLWALRLSFYMFKRGWGKPEDPRYGSWRKQYGDRFWIVSLFKVFFIQALFQWIISLGLQHGQIQIEPQHLTILDYVGLGIWIFGFFFESVADYQLAHFKKDPGNKGNILSSGLWRYSRHPNYFGESSMWVGIFIIVLSVPAGVFTIISPILITFTLIKVTGIAMMEKDLEKKPAAYRRYIENTSAFFPWFPK